LSLINRRTFVGFIAGMLLPLVAASFLHVESAPSNEPGFGRGSLAHAKTL
jgi:hypothetical protein